MSIQSCRHVPWLVWPNNVISTNFPRRAVKFRRQILHPRDGGDRPPRAGVASATSALERCRRSGSRPRERARTGSRLSREMTLTRLALIAGFPTSFEMIAKPALSSHFQRARERRSHGMRA